MTIKAISTNQHDSLNETETRFTALKAVLDIQNRIKTFIIKLSGVVEGKLDGTSPTFQE